MISNLKTADGKCFIIFLSKVPRVERGLLDCDRNWKVHVQSIAGTIDSVGLALRCALFLQLLTIDINDCLPWLCFLKSEICGDILQNCRHSKTLSPFKKESLGQFYSTQFCTVMFPKL